MRGGFESSSPTTSEPKASAQDGAQTFPAGRESIAAGSGPTSVVSAATAPRLGIDEATSGEVLNETQFRKEMHHRERKQARSYSVAIDTRRRT